jgi:DNA-binding IclR family transcriptional regulator
MKQHQADSPPVRSLATAFRIVEVLHERPSLTLTEIAEELDIAPSTAHRHLVTLHQFGYVCKEDGRYRTGLRFLEVGERARNRLQIYQVAKPKVEQLAEETGEIIQLMVEEGGMGVRLCLKDGERGVPTNTLAGQHVFLHTNSTGKAILANLPARRQEEIIERTRLPKQTENTITDPDDLRAELAEIRERGFAFNDGERIEGLRAVGTPVMGQNGEIVGAISVAGPSKRFKGDWFREELPSTISGAANEIELNLKYSRAP